MFLKKSLKDIGGIASHAISDQKTKNVTDHEMMRTFNCGIGFCLIVSSKNKKKIIKTFKKKFKPYVIGKITKDIKRVKLSGKICW